MSVDQPSREHRPELAALIRGGTSQQLVEDVILIPSRIVHGRARVVQPASRRIDVAVGSPAGEEGVVAHGADLVGVDGQALAVTTIASVSVLCQSNRRCRKKSSAQGK